MWGFGYLGASHPPGGGSVTSPGLCPFGSYVFYCVIGVLGKEGFMGVLWVCLVMFMVTRNDLGEGGGAVG